MQTEFGDISLEDFSIPFGMLMSARADSQAVRSLAREVLCQLNSRGVILTSAWAGKKDQFEERAILRVLGMYRTGDGVISTPWGRAIPHRIEAWAFEQIQGRKPDDLLKSGERSRKEAVRTWVHSLRRPNGPTPDSHIPKALEGAIVEKIKLGHFAR